MRINQITLVNVNSKSQTRSKSQNGLLNGLNSEPDSFTPQVKSKQPSFGIEPVSSTIGVGVFIWQCITGLALMLGIEAALAAVIGGGIYVVIKASEKYQESKNRKNEKIKKTQAKDLNSIYMANRGILTKNEVKKIYKDNLERVAIAPTGNGKEVGLNQVIGCDLLKIGLAQNVLLPMLKVMDGNLEAHEEVPNGINFFGPKGTGKTFLAKSLLDHYKQKGGYVAELEFVDNTEKDIAEIKRVFSEAEQRFHESGNRKYTMVLLDELEKTTRKDNVSNSNPIRNSALLKLVNDCKDRGVIFVTTSNDLAKVAPDMLRNGRTDLRIPVGSIAIDDIVDMVNFYVLQNGVIYDLDYKKIAESFETKNLAYKPKEVQSAVKMATKNISAGYLTTDKLMSAFDRCDIQFNAQEQQQFNDEIKMVKEYGGVNKNARFSNEDVVE